MANTDTIKPNVSHSFLLWWVLANIVGLPVLLISQGIGESLLGILSAMTDGMPIGFIGYLFALIILAFSGFIVGAWLGFWQWLVLRKQIPQVGKWILRSSIGVAIGTPLSWLVYGAIFASPIVTRPDGIYFSFWYGYLAFGIFLGLSVGVSQWLVLKQQVRMAGLWVVFLPLCFTFGISFANLGKLSFAYVKSIQRLVQITAIQFPEIELSNRQVFNFLDIVNPLTALVGISLIIGFLLKWLLQYHRKQSERQ